MSPSSGNVNATGLRALSLCIGMFLVAMGLDKLNWLSSPGELTSRLQEWLEAAQPGSPNRWYLETVAIPSAPVLARVIPVAEIAAGTALIFGMFTRVAAMLAFLMVLNFHFAADLLFHTAYFTNAYGLPVLGSLLALAVGGSRLPLSVME
ncbi:MAG: DoxX family membrane protein [Vicinamibacterales bacterium]